MTTNNYLSKKTYCKFDDGHFLLYLNEQPVEITDQQLGEQAEPVPGFSYTGNFPDGGTIIEATEDTYDAFVSGLIRSEYSASRVEAISLNRINALADPTIERAAEFILDFETLEALRESSKTAVKALLGM